MKYCFSFSIFLLLLFNNVLATDITINGNNLSIVDQSKDEYHLNKNWRFFIGDNISFASPAYDDSKWDTLFLPFSIEELLPFNYKGNVWIRSTFKVDEKNVSNPLSLIISQTGASEIYIDGKLIFYIGKVSKSNVNEVFLNPNEIPLSFLLDTVGLHTIAVRFSNHKILNNTNESKLSVFDLKIQEFENALIIQKIRILKENILPAIGIGIFIMLFIFNFIMFIFYKHEKHNLYYSLFSLAVSISFLISSIQYSIVEGSTYILIEKLDVISLLSSNIFLIALVYSFIYRTIPKRFWFFLSFTIIAIITVLNEYSFSEIICNILNIYCIIDIVVIVLISVSKKYDPEKKKRRSIKIVLGSILVIATIFFFINKTITAIIIGTIICLIVIPVAGIIFFIPLYLTIRHAKSFAKTNKSLEEQLKQVKELSEKTIEQEVEKKKMLETENERLEQMVNIRTAELAQKNNEIKDSINYAQRIQNAMLTDKTEINQNLKNCFILFKPKDIVSGDFYFYTKKENLVFIAAADCTGHGVPGALMSMIGAEKLMGIVNEYSNPSDILFHLNQGIKSSLKQTEQGTSTKDGMDISLTSIDLNTFDVKYSGANRPIWIIKNGATEIEEIKATKKAIGGYTEDNQRFEQHDLKFNQGDTYYLFTDGFADQFGSNGKKLMTKRFKELLLEIQHLSMPEQESFLNDFIENWKNGVEQIDDILVIGIRH